SFVEDREPWRSIRTNTAKKLEIRIEVKPLVGPASDQESIPREVDSVRPVVTDDRLLRAYDSQKIALTPIPEEASAKPVRDDELPAVPVPGHRDHRARRWIERNRTARRPRTRLGFQPTGQEKRDGRDCQAPTRAHTGL